MRIVPEIAPADGVGRVLNKAPHQSWRRVRTLIPSVLQPYLRGLRKRWHLASNPIEEPFRSVYPYTQVSRSRLENLIRLSVQIDSSGVPGDIVECGVLDGGSAALMGHFTRASGRRIHLFDSWQGLPEISAKDSRESSVWVGQCVGSPRRVRAIMRKMGVDLDRVKFYEGWFHDTFSQASIDEIALLHIDCDFYEPTRLCLETWYARLAPGGYVQIDDYSDFEGSHRAVDEFMEKLGIGPIEEFGVGGKAYFLQKR